MLLKDIRHNRHLAARRSPVFDKNRYAKVLVHVFVAFWAAYLVFIGVSLSFAFKETIPYMEAYDVLNRGLPIVLFIDFLIRFMTPLPSQEIRPYLLLPVRKRKLMHLLLAQTGLKPYNLFWLFFFVPFALMTVTRFYGIGGVIGYALGIWLLTVMNAYWSVLARTLIRLHAGWILLPILLYGGTAAAEILSGGAVSHASMMLGDGMICRNPAGYLPVLAVTALLWYLNGRIQYAAVYQEMERREDTRVKRIRQYKWLDKFGVTGEYMRLELKLIFRNKAPATTFKVLTVTLILFALMLMLMTTNKDFRQSQFTVYFYCIYCFTSYGIGILSRVIAYEGNYFDGIMARKGSLYDLLKGKYYMHCLLLAIPLCCTLPSAIWGSLSTAYVFGQCLFAAGVTLSVLMQLSLFNEKTAPLTASAWGKGQWNSAYQSVVIAAALFFPVMLSKMLSSLLDEKTCGMVCAILGIAGMAMQPLWLETTCRRFMKKRYKVMESLRNTR